MKINFTEIAWKDYLYWQKQDKRTIRKINQIIQDIDRNYHEGTRKPEALRGNLTGWWSRKIDNKNLLLYSNSSSGLFQVASCSPL